MDRFVIKSKRQRLDEVSPNTVPDGKQVPGNVELTSNISTLTCSDAPLTSPVRKSVTSKPNVSPYESIRSESPQPCSSRLLTLEIEELGRSETNTSDEDVYASENEYRLNNTLQKPSKSKTRVLKFRSEWLVNRPWLTEKNEKAFCKVCNKHSTNNLAHINRHQKSADHIRAIAVYSSQPSVDKSNEPFQKFNNKVKEGELRILMFLLENNLPFDLMSTTVEMIQSVASDSQIAKKLKIARTKSTVVTNTILKEEGAEDVAKALRTNNFSLIVDETTDISTSKCLAVVVRYCDPDKCVVRDRFFALIKLESGNAESIHNSIMDLFERFRIPLKNCIGFAADNASVMMGCNNGVQAMLKTKIPRLFVLGCVCHSMHLCSSAASKKIPRFAENLARDIYSYFSQSTKRLNELKDLQELLNVKSNKILKTSATRWLSLEQVVNRILQQWEPLCKYFLVNEFEDNVHDIGKEISQKLNSQTKAYYFFLSYVLKMSNTINLQFQSEQPRIHSLVKTASSFVKTIGSNILKKDILKNSELNVSLFDDDSNFVSIEDIYIGANAQTCFKDMSSCDIKNIKMNCKNYYVELCRQVLSRINLKDPQLNALAIIDPSNLGDSIAPLIQEFPNLISTGTDLEDIDAEWRSILHQDFVSEDMELLDFWKKIFSLKNGINEAMYPLLKRFLQSILSLPHSSATAERVFSKLALIKNKTRNRLDVPTVESIMLAVGLVKPNEKWMPSKALLNNYHKY